MGKIKLNLVSGSVVEKPLICAFKANNMNYIVLDNELNGSMGLPIILVCKIDNNKVVKIVDQNEWQIVKEYLKNIIAGNQIDFIKVPNELSADDIYYTQLTLPIPSFEALKKAYKVDDSNNPSGGEATIMDINTTNLNTPPGVAPIENSVVNTPVSPNVSPTPVVSAPVMDNPSPINQAPEITPTPVVGPQVGINPVAPGPIPVPNPNPIQPEPIPVVNPMPPVEPVAEPTPVTPIVDIGIPMGGVPNSTPIVETPISEPTPSVVMPNPMPTQAPISETTSPMSTPVNNVSNTPVNPAGNESIFKEQKEAFLQACENMFDALVQKFEKELENRK